MVEQKSAAQMLEEIEKKCKEMAKNEEEYRECVQRELKALLQTEEAQRIARETLEEHE